MSINLDLCFSWRMGRELCIQDGVQQNVALGSEGMMCWHEAGCSFRMLCVDFTSQRIKRRVEFFPLALKGVQEAKKPEWDHVHFCAFHDQVRGWGHHKAAVWGLSANFPEFIVVIPSPRSVAQRK